MIVARQPRGLSPLARRILAFAQRALLLAGLLMVSYVGYELADAHIFQAYQSWKLDRAAKQDLTGLPAGSVIGRVEVPRIGLRAVIVQGDTETILQRAVGHVPGTALPGQSGNVAIAGHRDSFFRSLRKIRPGDRIVLETPGKSYNYQVEATLVVAPTDVSVLRSSSLRQLTLITCYPFSWIGSAPNRFVVLARQIASPLPSS